MDSLASGEADLPSAIDEAHRVIRLLARACVAYRDRLKQELEHRYGSHSEKGGRGKGKGSGQEEPPSTASATTAQEAPGGASPAGSMQKSPDTDAATPGHGRRPIPPELPRLEVLIPLEDEHCLRCHGPVHNLERVESYRFDYVPGYLRVVVLLRFRCACNDPTCDGPIRIARLPPEPIPKGRATAAFLAHLLVIKFADHCPLYRFRKILLRQKVDLPLSTLVDYCRKATEILKPLWDLMRREVLASAMLQTDDTHVRVRLPGKKGVLKGHLWAYKGDENHPYVVFEFTPHWRGEAPQSFLATFKGYIQADAYKGYDALFTGGERIEVGCMAHARRKWVKARLASQQVADQALEKFGQLYATEEACKGLSPEHRQAVRQERSAPILEELRIWMADQKTRVLPKSAVGEAIAYAENQWGALTRYLEDGRLKIDNNDVEREMRGVALGRKNWLAAGSDVGGETAAIGYTMIASAQASGVEPVEWLTDVLKRIGTCSEEQLVELLPDRWKTARAAKPSTAAMSTEAVTHAATPADRQPTSAAQPNVEPLEGEPPSACQEDAGLSSPTAQPQPSQDTSGAVGHAEAASNSDAEDEFEPEAQPAVPPTTSPASDIASSPQDPGPNPEAKPFQWSKPATSQGPAMRHPRARQPVASSSDEPSPAPAHPERAPP